MEEDQASCDIHTHSDSIKLRTKWIFSLIFIPVSIFLLRSFIAKQIVYRASAYRASYMYKDSLRQYKKAVFLDGDNSDAWTEMGDVYKIVEDVEKAISAYRKAIEINPQNKKALYSLGMTLALRKQQYEEAGNLWNRVRELGPESDEEKAKYKLSYHRQSLLSLVTYYRRMNEPDKEADAQEELNRYYPPKTGAGEGANTSP
jgi:tetratricopeptide (TPR) repeat protein